MGRPPAACMAAVEPVPVDTHIPEDQTCICVCVFEWNGMENEHYEYLTNTHFLSLFLFLCCVPLTFTYID